MWTAADLVSDLGKLEACKYSEVSALVKQHPSDQTLLYRFNFITLLTHFKCNRFQEILNHSNAYLESIEKYIKEWTPDFLDNGTPSPPFDFMLLVFMTSTKGCEQYNKLISLFRFYKKIENYLTSQNKDRQILLTDKTRTDEMMVTVEKALVIIHQRLNYLAEIVASNLNSLNKKGILLNFLLDFVPAEAVRDDTSLSCFGRLALNCGDRELANKYFEAVSDSQIKNINKGYIAYFDNNFADAIKSFNGKIPAAAEACKLHMGEFKGDISEQPTATKKPTPESLTQWPAFPKI